MTETMTCPKCGHQHSAKDENDILIPQCPACGIYYFKYFNQKSGGSMPQPNPTKNIDHQRSQKAVGTNAIKLWQPFCGKIINLWKALAPKIKLSHLFFIAFASAIALQIHQTKARLNDPEVIKRMAEEKALKEARCRTDLKCLAEKYEDTVFSPCSRLIEQHAKYQFRWDGLRFTRYNWGNPEKTRIIYFGDAAQFQNGFGAWQNMIYSCTYDIEANSITRAAVTPGRLPH
jgi:predicted  nucleic acid-binding Zn-ribbon protein